MPQSFLWKASGVHTWKGGPLFLAPSETKGAGAPVITTSSGQKITGKFINDNEGRVQYTFPAALVNEKDLTLDYGGQTVKIGNGAGAYEGNDLADGWGERAGGKGSLGDNSGSFGDFSPETIGQFGAVPANLLEHFPSASLVDFSPIKKAPYQFIDPQTFAEQFGDFNRAQTRKNFDASKDMALEELGVELQGLEGFVPAASALKRRETSLDNLVNQEMRSRQVRETLPGVEGDLEGQRQRALSYASGKIPDAVTDAALSLNNASRGADQASAQGFGGRSLASSNLQELISAEERVKLSQYGDQLLTGNIKTKADLLLAPTEYVNAGSQINVNPSLSGSQLTDRNLTSLNNDTLINPTNALGSAVNQLQFGTNIDQRTREFNKSNRIQVDEFNSKNINDFALTKFGYEVGYAGALAGGLQNDINTQLGLQQQEDYKKIVEDMISQKQNSDQIQAITGLITSLPGIIAGIISLAKGTPEGGTKKPKAPTGGGGEETGTGGGNVTPPTDIDGGGSGGGGSTFTPSDGVGGEGTGTQPNEEGSVTSPTGQPTFPDTPAPNPGGTQPAPEPDIASFASDTGVQTRNVNTKALALNGQMTLSAAGISTTPAQGSVQVGYNQQGKQLFSPRSLAASTNTSSGKNYVATVKTVLDPLGVFDKEDSTTLDKIGVVAGDAAFLATLGVHANNKDAKGFVNAVLSKYQKPIIESLADTKQNQAGLGAAFSAYQLYSSWDNMSPAQKGIGLAAVGLQGYHYASGEDLGSKYVVKPEGDTPGLTVGQSLSLISQGYNAYSLAKNWNNLSDIQKVIYGTQSAVGIAKTAKQFGLEGFGTSGAAVSGVTAQGLLNNGFVSTPQFGVGAINGPAGNVPPGYTVVSSNQKGVIAVPSPNLSTWAGAAGFSAGAYNVYANWGRGGGEGAVNGAVGGAAMAAGLSQMGVSNPYTLGAVVAVSTLGGLLGKGGNARGNETAALAAQAASTYAASGTKGALGSAGGYLAAGVDAYNLHKNRGDAPKGEAGKTAALGIGRGISDFYTFGLAGAVGDYANKKARPLVKAGEDAILYGTAFGWAGLTTDALGIGGGLSKSHKERDVMRKVFQKAGVVDKKNKLQLADGSTYDFGNDESGGEHKVKDPDKLSGGYKGKKSLASWEVDYTNDLDYVSSMGGTALSRLMAGGRNKRVDEVGAQLGNAAISNVGHGKDMTPENFNKVMSNLRGSYSKAGITNKADAFALANQAAAEGRISMTDLVSMHQAFIMMYDGDKGLDTANALMGGRWRGVEAVTNTNTNTPVTRPNFSPRSSVNVRDRNRARYQRAA